MNGTSEINRVKPCRHGLAGLLRVAARRSVSLGDEKDRSRVGKLRRLYSLAKRGSQISFLHEHGYQIMRALIERGVIGDFRAPSTMRFGRSRTSVSGRRGS